MDETAAIDRYIEEHLDDSLAELSDLCALPTISARGEALAETATFLAAALERRGLGSQILPTPGAPVVFADGGGVASPTLLLYNHYDVQPPEPLDLWESPPFRLTVRDGRAYARGVADDKGQIACRLAAIDAVLAVLGELPCHLKVIVEGEEEIGSVHLPEFVEEQAFLLASDACLWEGGGEDFSGRPSMSAGVRGLLYVQYQVGTIAFDGHSGHAHLLPNAAWRLLWALASLKDRSERVLIPGFYDDVVPPTDRDLELMRDGLDEEGERRLKRMMAIDRYLGDRTGLEAARQVFEPTANIAGFESGYTGEGAKTIIPARARAKMDFRLVPNQNPHDIAQKLRRHLDEQGFEDVAFEILGAEFPGKTDPDDPFVRLNMAAAEEVYGQPCKMSPLIGGTGPYHPFIEQLGVPILTGGCGSPDNMIHAPNENIQLSAFVKGARHIARLLSRLPSVREER